VDVRDVARAYILAIQAEEEKVRGQIFNVSHNNYRISELALRVRGALRRVGVDPDIRVDYSYRGVRSYRVSTDKIERLLGFRPKVDIEESVMDMVQSIRRYSYTDYDHPRYYNIRWMRLLEEAQSIIKITGSVFEVKGQRQDA
jgi:nucleoside-diphosphate-sugar epimerase